MKKTPHFDVHIDRLAVSAIPPGGERRLREAIQQELTRLLAQRKDSSLRRELVPATSSRSEKFDRRSAALQIAEEIYRGLDHS
jgi:hypothetical protein